MPSPESLSRRLRDEARLDVDAELAAFGGTDVDAFLAHLRQKNKISDALFCELVAGQEISVARLLEVRADRTLVLGTPEQKTMIASSNGQKTLIAGGGAAPAPTPAGPAATRYAMLGCLGKGAMGEVHVARDEDLLRKVAYKRMVPEVAQSRDLAARFFSEIQVTAQLDHPNIVPIYGLEVGSESTLGYAMKLVQGNTLSKVVEDARNAGAKSARKGLATRLEIFLKVCDAMAYAHSKGVLHRDLKPENIMVGRYHEVYVMDWGICRLMGTNDPNADQLVQVTTAGSSAGDRTQFGAVLGTPAYMSPEQASGKNHELDGRSDQYALGLILHELISLTQAVPWADNIEDVLRMAQRGQHATLTHAPRELRAIVAKATEPDPADRYPDVSALADDLRRYLRGDSVQASPDNPLQRMARFVGRHRAIALASLLGLMVLGAGATIATLLHEERALAAARHHEARVRDLFGAVSDRSHAIDNHFYRFEGLLAGLAGSATEALARSRHTPSDTPVYHAEDFKDPARWPPDTSSSPYYGRPMSLAHASIKNAPDVSAEAAAIDERLLSSLRPALAASVLGSGAENDAAVPEGAGVRLLTEGLPVHRAFISLETGVHAAWPGDGGFPEGYDGRKRPKYRLAAGKPGTHWGNPYPDRANAASILLPMATSLWGPGGELVGVAGLDTTFEYLAENLLHLPGRAEIEDAYLVDERGQVVVHWSRSGKTTDARAHVGERTSDEPIPLTKFAHTEVLARAARDHAGMAELGGGKLAVYETLASLGWTYVVVADEARLLSDAR